MTISKYFNQIKNRPLDLKQDGCDLASWNQLYGKASFARHPKGFLVFLPPDKLEGSDQYRNSDPYTVEENITGPFHRRRIETTLLLLKEAVSSLHEFPRVLDLGCGQGHITDKMREAFPSAEITGLDYSFSAIEYAHDHYPGIDFAVGDVYQRPYSAGYFDIVVCNNLWEHVPDPLLLLSGIKSLLRPMGWLVISTPSRYRLGNLIKVLRGECVSFMSSHHVTEYTVGQVIEQLTYGGFIVRKVFSKAIPLHDFRAKAARWFLSILVLLVDSHHQLESTVFYLAQKVT